jgi:outer membrane murein-binding lipoprotein Lpp
VKSRFFNLISATAFVVLPLFVFAGSASAQVTTDIDQLQTDVAKLDNVMNGAAPVAIAAMSFGAGAKILKRVIYS